MVGRKQRLSPRGPSSRDRMASGVTPLLITMILPVRGSTGIHTHVRQFRSYLDSNGTPATLVTPFSRKRFLAIPVFGVRHIVRHFSSATGVWWYRHWHYVFLRHALAKQLRRGTDVVIYAQCPVSARAALKARRGPNQRVVMAVHFQVSQADEWVQKQVIKSGGAVFRSIRNLEADVLPRLDGIVYVSRSAREDLERWLTGLDTVASATIPNFVSGAKSKEPSRVKADLVSVGGLELIKNHRFLLHVLAAANRMGKRFTLDVMGEGPCRRDLLRLCRTLSLGGQVRFLGHRPDVPDRLPGYRVYVHSSTHDVLPFAIIEALAAGLPVVAGRVGGIPELFDPGVEGRIWPLDDPEEAARVLIAFMEDEQGLLMAGRSSRARFLRQFETSIDAPNLYGFLTGSPITPESSGILFDEPKPEIELEQVDLARSHRPYKEHERRVSVRAALTTFDQAVASISNFAVGVAVARVAGVAGLGAYSLAYTVWLGLASMHRSMITDPMAIENDLGQPDAKAHVRSGLAAELVLGIGCVLVFLSLGGILLASGQHAYGIGFMAIAPWLPFLLAQDYWRWVGFMKARPGQSLANDSLFLAIQVAAFAFLYALGIRSTVLAIGAWGLGALAGTAFGLWQFRVRPTLARGGKRLRMRWSMSKWLLGGSTSAWSASQAYVILTGVILGPVGLGGLKAATSLVSGPSLVLVQAGGSVGLPEASRALASHGWPGLRKVERVVTLAGVMSVGLIGVAILLYGKTLLGAFYGHQFTRFATTADILAASFFVSTIGLGGILSLKTTKQSRYLFKTGIVNLCGSVVAVVILAPLFGLKGAAVATLLASCITTAAVLAIHWRRTRREAERLSQVKNPPRDGDPPPGARVTATAHQPGPGQTMDPGSARQKERAYLMSAYPEPGPIERRALTESSARVDGLVL
jgi:glycosyltransferase involved in cell wall biosynthesis/O-antigen/teichoic acid export membrane protein